MVATAIRAEGRSQLIEVGIRAMVLGKKFADGTRAAALIGDVPEPLSFWIKLVNNVRGRISKIDRTREGLFPDQRRRDKQLEAAPHEVLRAQQCVGILPRLTLYLDLI